MNDKIGLDIIRTISATLDKAVYWIISVAYEIITGLAKVDIFKDTSDFAMRVYTLIGLFMIFKISFSLINYLINPDSIVDKEKGGGNLIKRIVITFVLIIVTPQAFILLKDAQTAILNDKILERFFLGESSSETGRTYQMSDRCNQATANSDGDYIALLVFRPFFQLEEPGTYGGAVLSENDLELFTHTQNGYCDATRVKDLLNSDVYNAPTSGSTGSAFGVYRVNYWFIVSSLVGGVVGILMVSFCMDVAVRAIKLNFLEIISPIPIVSYIDPSQGKNGMFKKWLSEVGKTWIDLFVRLGSLYFAINIISSLDNIWETVTEINQEYRFWLLLFIMIGALMFAKKLPSLIESITGIKLSGGFTLNPIKKFQNEALAGKAVTGLVGGTTSFALGAVGGAAANVLNNFKNRNNKPENWTWKKNLGGALTVTLRVGYYGAGMGYKSGHDGKYNPFSTLLDSTQKSSEKRNMAQDLTENNVVKSGPFANQRFIIKDKYTDVIGYRGKGGTTDEIKDKLKEITISKGLAEDRRSKADETLARAINDASDKFKETINNFRPFDRSDYTYKEDGTIEWKNKLLSASDFITKNSISFSDSAERSKFVNEYEFYKNNEQEYRDAYNELLSLNKKETKLSKNKEKFESVKNKASNSK